MRIAVLLALIAALAGQASADSFAGTWTADAGGKPLVRLELRAAGGALSGQIQLADIHVDAQGVGETVMSGLAAPALLSEVVVSGRTAAFARRDGDDIDHFEFVLLDDGSAELRFIPSAADREELAAQGIATPRPFRVRKVQP